MKLVNEYLDEAIMPVKNQLVYVDLDTVVGDDKETDQEIIKYLRDHAINTQVIDEHSPGHGWPEVRYIGYRYELEKFIKFYYASGDADSDRYIMSLIEPLKPGYDYKDKYEIENLIKKQKYPK